MSDLFLCSPAGQLGLNGLNNPYVSTSLQKKTSNTLLESAVFIKAVEVCKKQIPQTELTFN